ncbi:hypothetical protein BOG92_006095 [Streptomyces sp. WAC00263]|nr:hypothetical protein BOG92_006095 [Streptomyces sp. WAC00263]
MTRLGPVRRIRSQETGGASSTLVSGAWCVQLQGGGGSRRGASASDDNAADGRAKPRVCGMIRRTGPSRRRPAPPRPR